MRIFVINPGSTSTKVGLFEDEKCLYSGNASHDAAELEQLTSNEEKLDYRKKTILEMLADNGVEIDDLDAVVGRGGGLISLEGGTYLIDDLLLSDARRSANGVDHPANLGSQLAAQFAADADVSAYIVSPPDTDEYQEVARITGVKGVYRTSHLHALNLKETAIRHSALGDKVYEESNYIACHIGGGTSISAHRQGKMIDGFDIVGGEGPMTPTRCGGVAIIDVLNWMQEHDLAETRALCTKSGGFVSLAGTSDAREITRRAEEGDKKAALVWEAMLYQITKAIGSMAAVLKGDVDAILLSGGMVHADDLVEYIIESCSWIAPVFAYPGEFEMEAMAAGAIRVLTGIEEAKRYTGKPAWEPPAWLED